MGLAKVSAGCTIFPREDRDWLHGQAKREGITAGALARRLIVEYRALLERAAGQPGNSPS